MTTSTTNEMAALPFGATSAGQLLYGDLEHELTQTRRMLERVPDGRMDWTPHGKSMSLGRLATHVAELPMFAVSIVRDDELDFVKAGYQPRTLATTAEILALFDKGAREWREAVAATDFAKLSRPWTLRRGEHVIVSLPKAVLVRTMGISHVVHHRAQLSVYLRLLDIPVPGLYGPSADEKM
jgi:uncharacterized damage-inducible protein DinB